MKRQHRASSNKQKIKNAVEVFLKQQKRKMLYIEALKQRKKNLERLNIYV